jgi:hypothetical protein
MRARPVTTASVHVVWGLKSSEDKRRVARLWRWSKLIVFVTFRLWDCDKLLFELVAMSGLAVSLWQKMVQITSNYFGYASQVVVYHERWPLFQPFVINIPNWIVGISTIYYLCPTAVLLTMIWTCTSRFWNESRRKFRGNWQAEMHSSKKFVTPILSKLIDEACKN